MVSYNCLFIHNSLASVIVWCDSLPKVEYWGTYDYTPKTASSYRLPMTF